MHRLATRLVIAGMAVAAGVAGAGCSAAPGLAYAQGATRPASSSSSKAVTAMVPADARAKIVPAGPVLAVAGAPKGVKAKAGILVDATTGQVLWSEGENTVRPIASITKVMTALVILQAGGLDRKIAVPKAVTAYVARYSLSTSCCTRC
jgi:D-alanyl-D-alanine carboxypeptidase (penicillin-binding protein 5/6)